MNADKRFHPEADGPSGLIPLARMFDEVVEPARLFVLPSFDGAEFLRGASASAILAKLVRGDPLAVGLRSQRRRRERALLVDAARSTHKSLARVAYAALQYHGEPALDLWLTQLIDAALDDALSEDREGAADKIEPADHKHFEYVTSAWKVDARTARDACSAFNGLPERVRSAYWWVVLEGHGLARYVSDSGVKRKLVEARIERALITIGTLNDPGGVDGLDGATPGGGTHAS